MREYNQPVKKYWLKVTLDDVKYEYTILAINSDLALSMVNWDCDWDTITLRKLSDVVAMAQYGARNISGEDESMYLHYHARPV